MTNHHYCTPSVSYVGLAYGRRPAGPSSAPEGAVAERGSFAAAAVTPQPLRLVGRAAPARRGNSQARAA